LVSDIRLLEERPHRSLRRPRDQSFCSLVNPEDFDELAREAGMPGEQLLGHTLTN
jgi:hypothetical protein